MIHLRKKKNEEEQLTINTNEVTKQQISTNSSESTEQKKEPEKKNKPKKKKGFLQSILNPVGFAKKLYDDDQVMTNAATITLFMVMSLFPMLMILLWLMSRLMLSPEVLLKVVSSVLPQDMMSLVEGIVSDLYEKSLSVSALSITIIMALWSSSTGISFLVTGLNRVYKREEQRNWFVHRALCLLYTGIFLLIILLVMAFLVYGSKFRVFLISVWPVLENWTILITILQNAIAIGGMILFFLAVYNIFPQKRLPYRKQMPGAIVATVGWYGFSSIYAIYIRNSKNLAFMYGSLALIIVFLIWMYVCMNIVLIGGEVNFLYNNRYYYKLYLLTEKQIDIQEYFMNAHKEEEAEPEVVDEDENSREWEAETQANEVSEAEVQSPQPEMETSEVKAETPQMQEVTSEVETESSQPEEATGEHEPVSESKPVEEPTSSNIPEVAEEENTSDALLDEPSKKHFWKKHRNRKKKKSEETLENGNQENKDSEN